MTDFTLDWQRYERTGIPEAVLATGKSLEQLSSIFEAVLSEGRCVLVTRLDPAMANPLIDRFRSGFRYDPLSHTGIIGDQDRPRLSTDDVVILAAGTSDLRVAREACRTLAFHRHQAKLISDVGVAGLWRLMARIEEIRRARVVIAVAGMEGALFSVVGGLVAAPVIAVPTSVGYGVSSGGEAALRSALASCAPGVLAVNIDNGFGAAVAAVKMLATMADTTPGSLY